MNISIEKLHIIQKVIELQDADLIELIKSVIDLPNKSKTDWWDSISEQEAISIEKGLSDINEGKTIPHNIVREKYEKWLKD